MKPLIGIMLYLIKKNGIISATGIRLQNDLNSGLYKAIFVFQDSNSLSGNFIELAYDNEKRLSRIRLRSFDNSVIIDKEISEGKIIRQRSANESFSHGLNTIIPNSRGNLSVFPFYFPFLRILPPVEVYARKTKLPAETGDPFLLLSQLAIVRTSGGSSFSQPNSGGGGSGGSSSNASSLNGTTAFEYIYNSYGPINGGTRDEIIREQQNEILEIEFDDPSNKEAIDIVKLFNCFDRIPNLGAVYELKIYADVPVNDKPARIFNWSDGSPGHAFISIRKSNGGHSITQSFGFYPRTDWKSVGFAPVSSKIVADQQHEFNAALNINLTQNQFYTVKNRAIQLAQRNYDIDDYNCTNYALDVFNSAGAVILTIPGRAIPTSLNNASSMTPQELYGELGRRKRLGGTLANNIDFGVIGWAPINAGQCE